MLQPLVDILFLVVYASLYAAVFPFIFGRSENYGVLIPGSLSIAYVSLIWSALTWAGMPDTDGWIWAITMVTMPIATGVLTGFYSRARAAGKLKFVDSLGSRDAAADDLVILSA